MAKERSDSDKAATKDGQTARAAERAARQAANRAEREARRAARQAERAGRGEKRSGEKRSGSAPESRADTMTRPAQEKAPRQPPALAPALRPVPGFVGVAAVADQAVKGEPLVAPQLYAPQRFNIVLIGQGERLGLQAVLFAASLRRNAPDWQGRLIVAEPRPEGAWQGKPTAMPDDIRMALRALDAEILPFTATVFGASYPYGNKIEALTVIPAGQPFVFFDSDTLITGPVDRVGFDFSRPSASMRRTGTWPEPPLYGPGYGDIWRSLYDRFGLAFDGSLDLSQPDEHWERYLYFNAGWFCGADPQEFGRLFLDWAIAIRDDPGEALATQSLDPWLDQIALPLVIHALGGGRPGAELAGLDGWASCHYRNLSLLYAREADAVLDLIEDLAADPRIAPLLARDEAAAHLIGAGEGRRSIRPMFADRQPMPPEKAIRHQLRQAGLWYRQA